MTEYLDVCGINKFYERDIDMLIAEELRVNAKFCEWIFQRFGPNKSVGFPAIATNVSVVEDGSEADVVATFQSSSGLGHRLFIENKIDAMLMPEQLERYIRRAEGELRKGIISGYSIVFFTPSNYLSVELPSVVQQISFEEAAEELASYGDARSLYRAALLMRSLPLKSPTARDEQVIATDPYIKEWWDKVYAMLEREFPTFFFHKTRYPRSVYFAPQTTGQSRNIRVDFKGHKGEVDLAFKNVPAALLRSITSSLDLPGQIIENGRSSAIQIAGLEPFVISDGFHIIDTKVRAAYQATHHLLTFWKTNQTIFDSLENVDPPLNNNSY